jgi:prephenate dehydrogenase
MFNKVAIFGVGLIGASFALALKAAGAAGKIVGVERQPAARAQSRSD